MIEEQISKLGKVSNGFSTFKLKNALVKNDAGDWGTEPDKNEIGVIRSTNFSNDGKLDLSDVAFRTLKPIKRIEKLLSSGDILIERSGGSDSQPVGRVGLITNEIAKTDWAFANFIQRISLDSEIDPTYLYYCLQQMYEMGITASMQYQTTGIRNLDWKLYTKTILPKPPTPEQTAIATILSMVDETIAATQNSIKAAEKLKKALMQDLLTGKLKPDGSWRTEDEFYEYEKFGKVPMGWEVKTIKQLFDFYPTSSYSRSILIDEGEVGNIHYGDIHTKFDRILDLSIESVPFIPTELEKKYEKLQDGDLVVADASEDWDGVGKSIEIINSKNKKVIAGLHTLHLRPKSNDLILGIKGYLMNLYNVSVSIKRMATGAKVYGVNKSSLSKILLPIPSESEQQAIKEKLDEVSNEIIGKQSKIQTFQRLKKSLMQNLLTGKMRLPAEFIAQFENSLKKMSNTGKAE
ncbi:restriction endonuclease subunit S [Sulfurospirillum oryzae]|uniref:restriction endonuclease subunit S n=1 Tax=Sulfurospirillum oryzae TaxID=2976535 RepID=UPI0021E88055|nr:restriction endonuclease subunit S [Sulfurospirillum oryzae]